MNKRYIISLLFFTMLSGAQAALDCPFGLINDTYPGDCGSYIDVDKDSICDHSQVTISQPDGSDRVLDSGLAKISELTGKDIDTLTIGEIADHYSVQRDEFIEAVKARFKLAKISEDDIFIRLHDESGVCADELMFFAETLRSGGQSSQTVFSELSGTDIKSMNVKQVADFYGIDAAAFAEKIKQEFSLQKISTSDSFQVLHDNYEVRPATVKEIAASMQAADSAGNETIKNAQSSPARRMPYLFLELAIATTLIYIVSYVLAKMKKIPMPLHKKIWNIILLVSFIISGGLGLVLVIRLNYGWPIVPFNMLYWHVEVGIVLALVSIFHILWHSAYFLSIARK
jgi:hypothetical protein